MVDETVFTLRTWDLAFGKKAIAKDVAYESGMHLFRMTIREGTRITDVNFHPEAARELGEMLVKWADEQEDSEGQA